MSKIIIFFLLYLSISIKNETITNGIYEIKYKDQYLSYQPKKINSIFQINQLFMLLIFLELKIF